MRQTGPCGGRRWWNRRTNRSCLGDTPDSWLAHPSQDPGRRSTVARPSHEPGAGVQAGGGSSKRLRVNTRKSLLRLLSFLACLTTHGILYTCCPPAKQNMAHPPTASSTRTIPVGAWGVGSWKLEERGRWRCTNTSRGFRRRRPLLSRGRLLFRSPAAVHPVILVHSRAGAAAPSGSASRVFRSAVPSRA